MANKNRATRTADVLAAIADAPAANITAAEVRAAFGDNSDSSFSLLDDDSDDITQGTVNLFVTSAEKAAVGREWQTQGYVTGVDYTEGVTTVLALPAAAPSDDKDFVRVCFEGVKQNDTSWNVLAGNITSRSVLNILRYKY
jgi:hypothetical protein